MDLVEGEGRVVGGDHQRARERELEPFSHRRTVDQRHDRLLKRPADETAQPSRKRAFTRGRYPPTISARSSAGAEGPVPGACEHGDPQFLACLEVVQCRGKGAAYRRSDGVGLARPVKG